MAKNVNWDWDDPKLEHRPKNPCSNVNCGTDRAMKWMDKRCEACFYHFKKHKEERKHKSYPREWVFTKGGAVNVTDEMVPLYAKMTIDHNDNQYVQIRKMESTGWIVISPGVGMVSQTRSQWKVELQKNQKNPPVTLEGYRHCNECWRYKQAIVLVKVDEDGRAADSNAKGSAHNALLTCMHCRDNISDKWTKKKAKTVKERLAGMHPQLKHVPISSMAPPTVAVLTELSKLVKADIAKNIRPRGETHRPALMLLFEKEKKQYLADLQAGQAAIQLLAKTPRVEDEAPKKAAKSKKAKGEVKTTSKAAGKRKREESASPPQAVASGPSTSNLPAEKPAAKVKKTAANGSASTADAKSAKSKKAGTSASADTSASTSSKPAGKPGKGKGKSDGGA